MLERMLPRRRQRADPPPEYVARYRRDGFAVVPGMFSIEEVNRIRGAAVSSLAEVAHLRDRGYAGAPVDYRVVIDDGGTEIRFPAISFWPSLLSPYMELIRRDPRLAEIATAILGPDVKQLNNQFYFHLPGDGDAFEWHQDIMFRHPLDEYPDIVNDDGYLQTAIIVDEFSDEVAPLYMVPRSFERGDLRILHAPSGEPDYSRLRNRPDLDWPRRELGLEPEILHAQPGDVAVWCSLTVHASVPGPRDGTRMYYMNGFAAAGNSNPWPRYTVDGEVVDLVVSDIPAPDDA